MIEMVFHRIRYRFSFMFCYTILEAGGCLQIASCEVCYQGPIQIHICFPLSASVTMEVMDTVNVRF